MLPEEAVGPKPSLQVVHDLEDVPVDLVVLFPFQLHRNIAINCSLQVIIDGLKVGKEFQVVVLQLFSYLQDLFEEPCFQL